MSEWNLNEGNPNAMHNKPIKSEWWKYLIKFELNSVTLKPNVFKL